MSVRAAAGDIARDLILNGLCASPAIPSRFRWRLLRLVGLRVSRSTIAPGTFFGSRRVQIGERAFINHRCFFDAGAWITVEEDVDIAMGCYFITSTHAPDQLHKQAGTARSSPIRIGRGTWVGANVTVLPGVSIGPMSVIAAGSVVTEDLRGGALYAGAPAKYKKKLPNA